MSEQLEAVRRFYAEEFVSPPVFARRRWSRPSRLCHANGLSEQDRGKSKARWVLRTTGQQMTLIRGASTKTCWSHLMRRAGSTTANQALGFPDRPARHCSRRECSASRLRHRLLHRDHGRTRRADRKSHGRRDRYRPRRKGTNALIPWPQITVANADGASMSFEPVDVVVASAGATHPLLHGLMGSSQADGFCFR